MLKPFLIEWGSRMEKFFFKKKFGQNFITDENLLNSIADDAGVSGENVLEIGAGAGALTTVLCRIAKKVMSVEIDSSLKPVLNENLQEFSNLNLVFGDILKIDVNIIKSYFNDEPILVVANLPYYISTPILFWLIKSGLKIKSVTVMLQKELAERICASPNTKEYGSISVVIALWGKASITRIVKRNMFYPQPEVDSAILHIKIVESDIDLLNVANVVKFCFAMRRKTLVNNLMAGANITRGRAEGILEKLNLDKSIRAEALTKENYIALSKELNN